MPNPHSHNKPCLLLMAKNKSQQIKNLTVFLKSIASHHSRPPARMTGCYSVYVCVTGCLQGEVDKFPNLIWTHCRSFHLFCLSPFSHTFSLPSSFTRNRFEETCAWVRQAFPWFRHSEKDVSCSPDFPNDNIAHLLLLLFSSYTSLAGDPDLFTAALTDNVFFFFLYLTALYFLGFFFFTARLGVSFASQLLRPDFLNSTVFLMALKTKWLIPKQQAIMQPYVCDAL